MQLFNCIAHRNDTSHINDLTDEQIPSFKIAYDDMLELAGVLADTKATNAASNAEKERLQNIRQLADSVIEKINKRKAELQSPCTPEEICNRYKEMFGEELAPEDAVRLFVKEYGNDSLIKANGQRILYIYDMDEAMNAVHCKILGADAAENQKKRNEYLCQLRMYNGGIMPQDTLHSLMDCYTFVLSRDYVMSAQFERLLNGCISFNCQRYNLQLQISSSVLNEVKEKSLFDADSEARARCKMIDKQLERLKKDNRLHVVQINAKNTYSEADEFAELDSNRSMFYCLLTLRPDGFPDADSGKAPNVLFGKFLISGDFMLYRRSLERLHLSERTAGSDFKTTFCDENGNTVTLEHKSSSGGEGTIYTTDLEGKVAKQVPLAMQYLDEAAAQDYETARLVAMHYLYGDVVDYDFEKAEQYIDYMRRLNPKAAKEFTSKGVYFVAKLLRKGDERKINAEARKKKKYDNVANKVLRFRLCEWLAEKGSNNRGYGCYICGCMTASGDGVPRNTMQAWYYFSRGKEIFDKDCMNYLADHPFLRRFGAMLDRHRAGTASPSDYRDLAALYRDGLSVEKNTKLAQEFERKGKSAK